MSCYIFQYEPQMKKLMKVLSKTVAAVYTAYAYGSRHTWVLRKPKSRFMNADKRRYAPQRTLRTQSQVFSYFAVFAPFAVKFVEGGAK